MSGKKKTQTFEDMSRFDMAQLVANNALVAKQSGLAVQVRNGRVSGKKSILIIIEGYEMKNGQLLVANQEVATSGKSAEVSA